MFSEKEITYLKSQRLARIATVSNRFQPDVAPVGFEFEGQYFYIGGLRQTNTYKYKNVANGNNKVALVIDDFHGEAEIVERQGQDAPHRKVKPQRTWSWGIERPVFENGAVVMKKTKDADED